MTTKIGGEITDSGSNRAGLSQAAWNIVETRNGSNQTTYQYVWGTKYTDELILIDKNLDPTVDNDADADTAAEVTAGAEDARYLVYQHRNWNVIALSDYDEDSSANDAVIVERYAYTPYGRFVVLKGDSGGDQLGNVLMNSAVGNVFAHPGLPFDHEKGSYQNRRREYSSGIHRFVRRDPLQYRDGINLYQAYSSSAVSKTDPSGLCIMPPFWRIVQCWCNTQPWRTKCDPTGCGFFFAPPLPPPPQSPPNPGDPCNYPNRKVCWVGGSLCWESQCVCQCAGDSPGMNCVRGCIQSAVDNGAPATIAAERFCYSKCGMTPNETRRLDCCLNRTAAHGGCAGTLIFPPPMNPNPNGECMQMPIP